MNIFGQNINATQLNKANSEWQNGYGTQSDGMDTNSNNEPAYRITRSAKSIVIYFSRSGSTELVATKIAQETSLTFWK
jgi:Flavodoxins